MSSLEDAVNESVPGNDFVKPLMIAAGVLLLGHLFAGKKEEIPTDPSLPPAAGGGGLLGSLGGLFGGGAQQPGFPTGGAADPAGGAPDWQSDWSGRRALPDLIRIRIGFPAGSNRYWPDLVVAPRITVDAGCAYDPLTYHCKGR